jgi:hypothetical protein
MKRLLLRLALFAILLTPLTVFAGTFDDVTEGLDSTVAIEVLVSVDVIGGYPDGTFQPQGIINRAELMKVLVGAQGIDPEAEGYTANCFPDVVAGDWFEPYVCYAKGEGWVDGYDDGTFLPGNEVNRAEAAKMIMNVYQFDEFAVQLGIDGYDFTDLMNDVSEDDWFAPYVNHVYQYSIDDDRFNYYPGEGMTRKDTASFIFRSMAVIAMQSTTYNHYIREQFLLMVDLSELDLETDTYVEYDYTDYSDYTIGTGNSSDVDIYINFQTYGDLTVTNEDAGQDLTGYYLQDDSGTFYYAFSGYWDEGESRDIEADVLLNYNTSDNGMTLYNYNGDSISRWTTY